MSEFGYHDLERAAISWVLEDETWPTFLEWLDAREPELAEGLDLDEMRCEWVLHSENAQFRAIGQTRELGGA